MGTKYNKTVSPFEGYLLNKMSEGGQSWFDVGQAYEIFPDKEKGAVRNLLKRMADKGLIMVIGKGLYWIIPFEQEVSTYLPSWHLLAEPLAGDAKYYIGYYSALQIHGLITQPSLKEQIVYDLRKSKTVVLKGVQFQFIYHKPDHFFGIKKVWIDSYNKVLCSDLEKTILDCLFMPDYAGGIIEVAKALWEAREKLDFQKLLGYVERYNSGVIIKRLGYLLDTLGIESSITDSLLKMRSATVSPLDTEAPNVGKISTMWSIRQNVDIETITNAINN